MPACTGCAHNGGHDSGMTDARTRQADALVEGLQREAGGKLTVFLGARRAWARPTPC
jgi:hypothetical protein